jgi:isochorismate synthase
MTIFEKVALQFENELPFVLYVEPNQQKICALLQEDNVLHTFEGQDGFLMATFELDKIVVIPKDKSTFIEDEKENDLEIESSEVDFQSTDEAQENFEKRVAEAVSEIQNGVFEKVVLSRSIEIPSKIAVFSTFKRMMQGYPTAFCSLFYHPKIGCWMGATPEQLVKVSNKKFETVSLAGTYSKATFTNWTHKEMHEQQVVTDYIVNSVKSEVKNITISKPETVEAGQLVHLKTMISGEIESSSALKKMLQQLHPTPAVCGFPTDVALDFILKNEKYNREFYSGYLGLWEATASNANLFVNLRCMQVQKNKVVLYVGCGITANSNPTSEFLETEYKSMTMRNIL